MEIMRSRPKHVEVLIASYNTRDLLRTCLATLFAHAPEAPDVRLHAAVFDNGSSDGSPDMVAAEFPDVRLVRSERNLGFARANNALAASSTADYLMLLNSDTIMTMDVVSPLLSVLESAPVIGIVGPKLIWPDGSIQPSSQRFPTLRFELALLFGRRLATVFPSVPLRRAVEEALDSVAQPAVADERTHDTDHLWATCWLLRRLDVAYGLFDESFVTYDEDLDYCRRIRESGRRIVWVPSAQLVHLGSQSSDKLTKLILQGYGRRRYYSRHHGAIAAFAYGTLSSAARALKRIIYES
jgi:GT2 family glycosyltransferase